MALSTDSLELEGSRNLTRNLEMAAGQTGDGSEDTLAGMSDPRQLMALGASYKKEGRFAKAVQAYERVCESDKKNPDAPVQLAMCLMHAGEMERADITFQKALEFYDNVSKPELWHALGQLYALQEKSTQAEEALNQVIETATLSVDVHFRLAALACAAMNYDKAVDHLKRAASACDSDSDAEPTAAGVWFELGDVYALKGDSADESTQAFENSGLSQGDHAAWHAHGAMLDRLVGFAGKGGALRRKALRAMVRSVEMATDQPQYWHTLANLHRKMGSHDEAFSALEHYAHLSVARADRGEAEVEALRASLQEAGESTMQLSEELSRVRASYAEEQLANKDAHTQREQHARELQSSQRTVQGLHKEIDKYKGWFEAIKKENRLCKADVERAQRLVREANTRTDEALARVPPLKQEIAKQQKTIQEKARQISEMLGNQGSAEMTPLEKVEEMEQKCARLEMAAVEAEGSATEVRREAARRVREVESQSRATVEELESTRSRLAVCEKKLVAARQELGMLKGTPDGEAFAAAAKYKQEVAKSLELAKQRGAEASQAREREHLARCQAEMIEGQLRNEIAKLKESRARLATRLQGIEERAADDHEEMRKIQALDVHWKEQAESSALVLQEERIEIERWKSQYKAIKGSLDSAAETAVAQQALKVVSVMDEIEDTSTSFESFLEAVLSQSPHHTHPAAQSGAEASASTEAGINSGQIVVVEPSVAVEMGVQCDGVYAELDEDTRLKGMDAGVMLERCKQVQASVRTVLEDARDTIHAQRQREATLHDEAAAAAAREKAVLAQLKDREQQIRALEVEMDEVVREADARVESENELRKFTEWKMRAKAQENQRRLARQLSSGRKDTLQFQQDKMAEMLMGGAPSRRPQSAGLFPAGGSGSHGRSRPQSAQGIIQSIGARGVDRYLHPQPQSQRRKQRGGQRPVSAAASLGSIGITNRPGTLDGSGKRRAQVEHRHPAFYGSGGNDGQVDLQESVDRMNSSSANVGQLMSGLDKLKAKRDRRFDESSRVSRDSDMFDPRNMLARPASALS